MPDLGTYVTFFREKNLKVDEASLRQYLDSVLDEDANAEFKTATDDVDFQFRKAVASIGNRHGGEVFVGVKDPGHQLSGTGLTEDQLNDRLRQKVLPGDWYSVDLSTLIIQTTSVPLSIPDKRVIVAEVRPGLFPCLVVDEDGAYGDRGGLIWFRRHGRTDRRLTAYEGVEARRSYQRGKLLLELFREFETTVRMIPSGSHGGSPVARAYFSLPRYDAARADGSLYSVLEKSDIEYLVASRPNDQTGFGEPGLLPRFIATGEMLDREIDRFRNAGNTAWSGGPDNDLRAAREGTKPQVVEFKNWLKEKGVLV
ncbi:MAG: helix-turn-helix domain-containing protein [Thermoplasmata archaeon]